MEQLSLLASFGIELPPDELASPATLHARTGACIARRDYNADDAVCTAIDSHTTGRPGMTTLEKLLLLADFIEPGRKHPACAELRALFCRLLANEPLPVALDRAVLASLDSTLTYLIAKNKPVVLRTVQARNHLLAAAGNQSH